MKKFIKISFYTILLFTICLYLSIVFLLPQIVNNRVIINKLQSLIYSKTAIETNISGLNLKISPKLKIVLNVDSITAKDKAVTVANIENLSLTYKLLENQMTLFDVKDIYIDGNALKQLKKTSQKKRQNKFDFNKFPEVHIKNIVFKLNDISVFAKNIEAKKGIISLNADIQTKLLSDTLKLGYSGLLHITEDNLEANQFEIRLGNSHLYLNGILVDKDKVSDFNVRGEKLPVSEIMPIILHLQKAQDPSRKFVENFKNFKGTANVNLKYNKDGIWGTCIGNNLSANAVWFDIPLYFKKAVFNFRGQKVDSIAEGILGKEKVIHTLNITDLLNPQKKEVIGTMKTTLTKKFDYIPNLTVLNSVNAGLVYKIKNKKPDVYYDIDIPVNSDLIYNSFSSGLFSFTSLILSSLLLI